MNWFELEQVLRDRDLYVIRPEEVVPTEIVLDYKIPQVDIPTYAIVRTVGATRRVLLEPRIPMPPVDDQTLLVSGVNPDGTIRVP